MLPKAFPKSKDQRNIGSYIRPKKCPSPPQISNARFNATIPASLFFKSSLPTKYNNMRFDDDGVPFPPVMPYKLPLLPGQKKGRSYNKPKVTKVVNDDAYSDTGSMMQIKVIDAKGEEVEQSEMDFQSEGSYNPANEMERMM